jgi:hypothetical protein
MWEKHESGRSRPRGVLKPRESIVVVARQPRIARCNVAVRLFPWRAIAIDFTRRAIAVGFTRRDIAIGLPPGRTLAPGTVAGSLARSIGSAKLTVALATCGTPPRSAAISAVGEAALSRRSATLSATRATRCAHSLPREWRRIGVAHRLLRVEVGTRAWRARRLPLPPARALTAALAHESFRPWSSLAARTATMLALRTLPRLRRRSRLDVALDERLRSRICAWLDRLALRYRLALSSRLAVMPLLTLVALLSMLTRLPRLARLTLRTG